MGTRFLVAEECPLHPRVKEVLLSATELDTVLVMRSVGNTHRVWKNRAAEATSEMETRNASLQELFKFVSGEQAEKMYLQGELHTGLLACGQGIGLVRDIKPAREIILKILKEAGETRERLKAL
jgi:NAD(P)H-dependent flavin oxidoreductase YrpB (nitropropane dioxygenase family)